jgi:hypothetical protein
MWFATLQEQVNGGHDVELLGELESASASVFTDGHNEQPGPALWDAVVRSVHNVPSHTVAAFFEDLQHIKQLVWVSVKQSTNILDQRHPRSALPHIIQHVVEHRASNVVQAPLLAHGTPRLARGARHVEVHLGRARDIPLCAINIQGRRGGMQQFVKASNIWAKLRPKHGLASNATQLCSQQLSAQAGAVRTHRDHFRDWQAALCIGRDGLALHRTKRRLDLFYCILPKGSHAAVASDATGAAATTACP